MGGGRRRPGTEQGRWWLAPGVGGVSPRPLQLRRLPPPTIPWVAASKALEGKPGLTVLLSRLSPSFSLTGSISQDL